MKRRHSQTRLGPGGPSAAGTFGSLAGLLALAIGVPVLLVAERAGSPFALVGDLFTHPSSVLHSLGHPVTDGIVLRAVLLVAWVTWAWLVACVITEVVARLRGTPTSRLPASRHVQALVALVVGASLALLPFAKGYAPMRIAGAPTGPRAEQILTLVDDVTPGAKRGTGPRQLRRSRHSIEDGRRIPRRSSRRGAHLYGPSG